MLHIRNIGGICISETSSIFPVSVTMHTPAVEHKEDVFWSSPLLYTGKKGKPEASTGGYLIIMSS